MQTTFSLKSRYVSDITQWLQKEHMPPGIQALCDSATYWVWAQPRLISFGHISIWWEQRVGQHLYPGTSSSEPSLHARRNPGYFFLNRENTWKYSRGYSLTWRSQVAWPAPTKSSWQTLVHEPASQRTTGTNQHCYPKPQNAGSVCCATTENWKMFLSELNLTRWYFYLAKSQRRLSRKISNSPYIKTTTKEFRNVHSETWNGNFFVFCFLLWWILAFFQYH